MDFLLKGYTALQGDLGQAQTGPETVDRLCDRAQSSTLIEDRRAAVVSLKALARDYQLEVGTRGMPVFTTVLREDRGDVEVLRAALEALNVVCTAQTENPTEQDLGVMFTEIFVKNSANVSLLLGLLEIYDFYVRYHTVTLLTLLLENRPKQLQACILESPLGVSRLMDLLDDPREIIRNEGLLLLISLTKANNDIQKIVAFENAFERLLTVISDEGMSDGGIIVADCLHLMLNLLRGNVSNQNYFRETGGFSRLPALFVVKHGEDGAILWLEQQQTNLSLMMDLVRLFVSHRSKGSSTASTGAGTPSTLSSSSGANVAQASKATSAIAANQATFAQNGTLQAITDLALAQDVPLRIKNEALLVTADVMRGLPAAQDLFAKGVSRATSHTTATSNNHSLAAFGAQDAVSHLITLAITTATPWNVRTAAAYAFKCYLHKRSDIRLVLMSSLASMPPSLKAGEGLPSDAPGPLVFRSLLEWESSRKDPYQVWMASLLLGAIINGESKCKDRLLDVQLALEGDERPSSFLAQLSHALQSANDNQADVRVIVAYLSLMATLFSHHTKAVKAFLQEGSDLQFLLEQVSRSTGVESVVQSLAAFVLGLVLQFNDNSGPTMRKKELQDIIVSRIGEDQFSQKLQNLRDSEAVRSNIDLTVPFKPSDGRASPIQLFDQEIAFTVLHDIDEVERAVLESPEASLVASTAPSASSGTLDPSMTDMVVESYKSLIREQDNKIALMQTELQAAKAAAPKVSTDDQLRVRNIELQAQVAALQATVQTLTSENQTLHNQSHNHVNGSAATDGHSQREFQQLQQQLEAEQLAQRELQSEHDDLLVILAESDEKIKQLKTRLRELGQEVSDDDNENDEAEDEAEQDGDRGGG